MKKTTIAAAFLILISTCVFADNKDKEKEKAESTAKIVNNTENDVYKLHYSSNKPGRVAINIQDAKGKLILIDYIISKEGFIRPYNFQELADGEYFVTINDRAGRIKIPVAHKSIKKINFVKADVKALPANRKYELSMIGNLGKGVVVTIYDKFDKIIYSEAITVASGFSKVYDLSKIENREITFEVRNENKVVHTERF